MRKEEGVITTVPDIKSALHRGRTWLRDLAKNVNTEGPAPLDEGEREQLTQTYRIKCVTYMTFVSRYLMNYRSKLGDTIAGVATEPEHTSVRHEN